MKFIIDQRLPTLNEYSNYERMNRYKAAEIKRKTEEDIGWYIKIASAAGKLQPISGPFRMILIWHVAKSNRSDPDNICFAKKFILDALQRMEIIENDSQKYVRGISDLFILKEDHDYVVVVIDEETDH